MTMTHSFEYFRPKTVKEACQLLKTHKGSVVLAGGTDLCNMLKDAIKTPSAVIDLKQIKELKTITIDDHTLRIGALVTFTQIMASKDVCDWYPVLAEAAATVASGSTRNRATMVGNITTAVPSADSAAPLMAYDTVAVIESAKGTRRVPLEKFFVGPRRTVVKPDEIVTYLEITTPHSDHAGIYLKHTRYSGEDLAQSGMCILAFPDHTFRVGYSACAPTPLRGHKLEKLINGKQMTEELMEEAKKIIDQEISPITDIRSTSDYRRLMMKIMFERGYQAVCQRLIGEGPEYHQRLV